MNLQQIYDECDRKSYYSRTADDILSAINAKARFIYDFILKENRGYWLKWDTTTIVLAVATEVYNCPADLETLLRMRERPDASSNWNLMTPASGLTATEMISGTFNADLLFADGPVSQFSYYGPYLGAAAAQQVNQGAMSLRVGPIPQSARQTELVYVVKYVDIVSRESYLLIPDEGSGRIALRDLAIAELVRTNGDSLADDYEAEGMKALTLFLSTVRLRQQQATSTQQPYLSDLD